MALTVLSNGGIWYIFYTSFNDYVYITLYVSIRHPCDEDGEHEVEHGQRTNEDERPADGAVLQYKIVGAE